MKKRVQKNIPEVNDDFATDFLHEKSAVFVSTFREESSREGESSIGESDDDNFDFGAEKKETYQSKKIPPARVQSNRGLRDMIASPATENRQTRDFLITTPTSKPVPAINSSNSISYSQQPATLSTSSPNPPQPAFAKTAPPISIPELNEVPSDAYNYGYSDNPHDSNSIENSNYTYNVEKVAPPISLNASNEASSDAYNYGYNDNSHDSNSKTGLPLHVSNEASSDAYNYNSINSQTGHAPSADEDIGYDLALKVSSSTSSGSSPAPIGVASNLGPIGRVTKMAPRISVHNSASASATTNISPGPLAQMRSSQPTPTSHAIPQEMPKKQPKPTVFRDAYQFYSLAILDQYYSCNSNENPSTENSDSTGQKTKNAPPMSQQEWMDRQKQKQIEEVEDRSKLKTKTRVNKSAYSKTEVPLSAEKTKVSKSAVPLRAQETKRSKTAAPVRDTSIFNSFKSFVGSFVSPAREESPSFSKTSVEASNYNSSQLSTLDISNYDEVDEPSSNQSNRRRVQYTPRRAVHNSTFERRSATNEPLPPSSSINSILNEEKKKAPPIRQSEEIDTKEPPNKEAVHISSEGRPSPDSLSTILRGEETQPVEAFTQSSIQSSGSFTGSSTELPSSSTLATTEKIVVKNSQVDKNSQVPHTAAVNPIEAVPAPYELTDDNENYSEYGLYSTDSHLAPCAKGQANALPPPSADKITLRESDFSEQDVPQTLNLDFQSAMEMSEGRTKYERLAEINESFISVVKNVGKIIISERNAPIEEKTFKPAALGGIAGGEKFIVKGVLFKYAVDTVLSVNETTQKKTWMYGLGAPQDHLARKAAGNELRAFGECSRIARYQLQDLKLPLMALLDYQGHRLLAMTLLPLKKGSLIYGSCDAGRTVHNDEPKFRAMMNTLGQELNLQPHEVGGKQIALCGDIEGHKASDGRFYCLDFGRVFPPEAPDPEAASEDPRWIFYKHMRPEFVRAYSVPLCSDAFSRWQASEPRKSEFNAAVTGATRVLYDKVIPSVASKFNEDQFWFKPDHIVQILHSYGINLRLAGRVRSLLKREWVRQLFLTEMLVRTLKNVFNDFFREIKVKVVSDAPLKAVIVSVLNALLDHTSSFGRHFWCFDDALPDTPPTDPLLAKIPSFKHLLKKRFPLALTPLEENLDYSLHGSVLYHRLFVGLEAKCGFQFTQSCRLRFSSFPRNIYFVQQDIEHLEPKLSHMSLVDYYYGKALQLQAAQTDEVTQARILTSAFERLSTAKNHVGYSDPSLLLDYGQLTAQVCKLWAKSATSSVQRDDILNTLETAIVDLDKAISMRSENHIDPMLHAQFHVVNGELYTTRALIESHYFGIENEEGLLNRAKEHWVAALKISNKALDKRFTEAFQGNTAALVTTLKICFDHKSQVLLQSLELFLKTFSGPSTLSIGLGFDPGCVERLSQILRAAATSLRFTTVTISAESDLLSEDVAALVKQLAKRADKMNVEVGDHIQVKRSSSVTQDSPQVRAEHQNKPLTSSLSTKQISLPSLVLKQFPHVATVETSQPLFPVIAIGNRYLKLREASASINLDAHHWAIYVNASAAVSHLIEKVTFLLHPSMRGGNVVTKTAPPYEFSATTWGYFNIPVTIYFHEWTGKKPLVYVHPLSLAILRGSESVHEVFW